MNQGRLLRLVSKSPQSWGIEHNAVLGPWSNCWPAYYHDRDSWGLQIHLGRSCSSYYNNRPRFTDRFRRPSPSLLPLVPKAFGRWTQPYGHTFVYAAVRCRRLHHNNHQSYNNSNIMNITAWLMMTATTATVHYDVDDNGNDREHHKHVNVTPICPTT